MSSQNSLCEWLGTVFEFLKPTFFPKHRSTPQQRLFRWHACEYTSVLITTVGEDAHRAGDRRGENHE